MCQFGEIMAVMADAEENLLRNHSNETFSTRTRTRTLYQPLAKFTLPAEKHYQQQYSDIYFLRLAKLKPTIERIAAEAWDGLQIAGEVVRRVERVLEVRQGELCWVAGTVYVDSPLKPNVLEDIAKDHWISAPPPREKYVSPDGAHHIMLEDESGRLRLVGASLASELLVTGCIIAVMGTEDANGDFEVVDIRLPELAPQPQRWERDDLNRSPTGPGKKKNRPNGRGADGSGGKVAIVSGLGISGDEADDLAVDLLMEYLLGEATCPTQQEAAARITRLIIAGDAVAESSPLAAREELVHGKKATRKYRYDSSAYNAAPTARLDSLLETLLPSMPVTLIPGANDPVNVSLPQQPIHPAMLPHSRAYAAPAASTTTNNVSKGGGGDRDWSFDSGTNPWESDVGGWRLLGTGGQPIDDIYKYVTEEVDRLEVMEHTLRWQCCAPTAPDTLWCYPYQDDDPFVISECPHVYFVGNQPRFQTTVLHHNVTESRSMPSDQGSNNQGTEDEGNNCAAADKDDPSDRIVRLITVPRFKETGQLVLLDLDMLDVELVQFDVIQ